MSMKLAKLMCVGVEAQTLAELLNCAIIKILIIYQLCGYKILKL